MKDSLPTGELILLCDNSYLVEKVLYSNLHFDAKELLHKSLISVADVHSFDAVLQLVSDLREQGFAANWPIRLILGEHTYNFTFSGTFLQEHVVLTAHLESPMSETSINGNHHIVKNRISITGNYAIAADMASEDMRLMEEINRLNREIASDRTPIRDNDGLNVL